VIHVRMVFKERGRLWPKVAWEDSRLVVYYLGVDPEDVSVREAAEIDFEELLLRLDTGSSVYMTLKPRERAAK
jgi:hypothetical protein